jgi:hypothetical protein
MPTRIRADDEIPLFYSQKRTPSAAFYPHMLCHAVMCTHLQEAEVTWEKLLRCLMDGFLPNLLNALKRQIKKQQSRGAISSVSVTGRESGAPGSGTPLGLSSLGVGCRSCWGIIVVLVLCMGCFRQL